MCHPTPSFHLDTKIIESFIQVGELVFTSNLDSVREEKMKQGRLYVVKKLYAGYEEEPNSLQALDALADLNKALTDIHKVSRIFLMRIVK